MAQINLQMAGVNRIVFICGCVFIWGECYFAIKNISAAGLFIGHPADTIKVRQQFMNEKFISTVVTTLKHEGPLGFYKGLFAPFLTIGISNAVFFCSYGSCIRHFQGTPHTGRVDLNDPNWKRTVGIAGCVAGFAQVLVTCPVELVKTILQTSTGGGGGKWAKHYHAPYKNTAQVVKGIFKKRNIPGFYRGLVPMFWRDVPTSGLYMIVYETLLPHGTYKPLWQQISAGGFAGVASWLCTIPFDVVKSRIQGDNPNKPKYKGMIDCFQKSLQSDGPRIFMRGFWLITARAFPVNAAILFVYESVLNLLKKSFT